MEDEADPDSENDFGNNIIPSLLRDGREMYAYHFSGYWKDVGTIASLWEATWKCWIRSTAELIFLMTTGKYTAGTAV